MRYTAALKKLDEDLHWFYDDFLWYCFVFKRFVACFVCLLTHLSSSGKELSSHQPGLTSVGHCVVCDLRRLTFRCLEKHVSLSLLLLVSI